MLILKSTLKGTYLSYCIDISKILNINLIISLMFEARSGRNKEFYFKINFEIFL